MYIGDNIKIFHLKVLAKTEDFKSIICRIDPPLSFLSTLSTSGLLCYFILSPLVFLSLALHGLPQPPSHSRYSWRDCCAPGTVLSAGLMPQYICPCAYTSQICLSFHKPSPELQILLSHFLTYRAGQIISVFFYR